MTRRDDGPSLPWGLLYLGLAIGWVSEVAVIVMWYSTHDFLFPIMSWMVVVVILPLSAVAVRIAHKRDRERRR